MKNKLLKFWPIIFIFSIWFIFASPFIFKNLAPFPSDYQVNSFSPWTAYPELAGPVKNGAMPDLITQIYPWKHFTISSFFNLQIPLWDPYSFTGMPHLANYQSAVLSPFNILFFIFKFVDAWSILILLQPLLAGIFMYIFVRTIGPSKIGSLISSVSFMFCGFITVWLSYGTLSYAIIFTPLALFAIEKFYQNLKYRYIILLSLSIPMSFFSGHFQISLYFLSIILVYSLYKFIKEKRLNIFLFSIFGIFIGILFSLPQVLPSIELYLNSLRSSIFQKGEVIPWANLPTFISPDFFGNPVTRNDWFGHYAEWNLYIGVVPFFLGFYSLLIKKKTQVLFLFFFGLSALFLAFDTPILDLFISAHIPVLSTSAASRIISVYCFFFTVLSVFGFDQLLKDLQKEKSKKVVISVFLFILIFCLLWGVVVFRLYLPLDRIVIARQNLIFPTLIFIIFFVTILVSSLAKNKKIYIFLPFVILFLVCFDMLRFATKWQPFESKKLVFLDLGITSEFNKISGNERVFGGLDQHTAIYYRLPFLDGYDALYPKRYGEFVSAVNDGELKSPERSVVTFPKNGKYTKKILDLLGVKYIVQKVSDYNKVWSFPVWEYKEDDLKLIYDDGKFQIFKNKNAFPRAFIVSDYTVKKDRQEIIDTLLSKDFDAKKSVVLENDPEVKKSNSVSSNVVIKNYSPNAISIIYKSDKEGILFLSDNYYPGWKAYVDSEETKILRANYTFRAIKVPVGRHLVEFKYQPESFIYGLWFAGVGVLMLILGVLFRKRLSR